MAKWDVFLSHKASSRTVKKTVDAGSRTQAMLTAQATFDEPHQWHPFAAAEVPAGYYETIAAWADERDIDINERELDEAIERERFDTYNER